MRENETVRPPVDDILHVQVLQSTGDLCRVEHGPFLLEAGAAHVVNVEFEVSAVHQRQHETERIFRLKRICQTHL